MNVGDTRSGFSIKKEYKITVLTQSFHNSSTLASSGVKENAFPINIIIMLWKIVLNNIVFITHDGVGELFC